MTKSASFLLKFFIFCFLCVSQLVFFTNFSQEPFLIQKLISTLAVGGLLAVLLLQSKKEKDTYLSFSKADIILLIFVALALISLIINFFVGPNGPALLNDFFRKDLSLITGLFGGYFIARLLCNNCDFLKTEDSLQNYKTGFLFFLWGILWLPFNYFRMEGLFDVYALLMWGGAFYLAFRILKNFSLKSIIDILLITATLASAYGLCQTLGYDFIGRGNFSKDFTSIASSTFGNPNFLASFLLLTLPPGIIFYLSSKTKGEKTYYFLINLICITFFVLSQSRSSWIGAIFALFVLISAKPFRTCLFKNKIKIGALFLALISIFLIFSYRSNKASKVSEIKGVASTGLFSNPQNLTLAAESQALYMSYHQRLMGWTCGIDNIKKKPLLGWGWGSWQLSYAPCQGELLRKYPNLIDLKMQSNSAHNIFMETLVQSGILGLIAFLLWLFFVCSNCIKYYHIQKNSDRKILILAVFASCGGFLADNMLNITFEVQVICSVFYFFVGVLASLDGKNREIKISKILFNLLLFLIAFIFLYLSFIQTKILLASHYGLKGYFAMKANNYKEAQKMFDKSINLYKGNPETHFIYLRALETLKDYSKMYGVSLDTLKYFPEYYEFYNIYAIIETKFNKPNEAFSYLKKSFALNPYFEDSLNLTLHLFISSKELRTLENAAFLEKLNVPLSFKNAFSLILWQIYFEQEQYDKARAILLDELARNKFDKNIQEKLALTNEKLNIKKDSALEKAKMLSALRNRIVNAKEITPAFLKELKAVASDGDLDAQMLLAQAYFKQQDYQNCRLILENLYQNNADNLPLNFAFASLEEAQGNKEEAKKYLQNILLKDKKNVLALRRIKSII